MVVDYDLVVLGATLEAREAAMRAAEQGARAALVAPAEDFTQVFDAQLTLEVLSYTAAKGQWTPFEAAVSQESSLDWPVDWSELRQRLSLLRQIAYSHLSYEQLAIAGIDVVLEAPQLSPRPRLAVTTATRRLRARGYLLAYGGKPALPSIPGIDAAACWQPETLLAAEALPDSVLVLGRGGDAIALAQLLALLGVHVTLVTRSGHLLPGWDEALAEWAITLLETAGVAVHLNQTIVAIAHTADQVQLTTDQATIQATRLLLATSTVPAWQGLDLKSLGFSPQPYGLAVDDYLRTVHPRIFACGPVLGGSRDRCLARYEAQIAVQNALYLPRRRVNYRAVPQAVLTSPPLAQVGLKTNQAQRWYGPDVQVLSLGCGKSRKAQLRECITGQLSVVVHTNGQLLGAHLVGPEADELVQTLALLVDQPYALKRLSEFPMLPHSHSELLRQLACEWREKRWRPGRWRRDWAENWFNWRRSRWP